MLTLKLAPKPVEQPKKNKFLEETFQEFKARIFDINMRRLNFLMDYKKDIFVNTRLKKYPGFRADLLKGETRVMCLTNHEVVFYVNSELVTFLKLFFKFNPNAPLDNSSVVNDAIKQANIELNENSPFNKND